MASTGGRCSAYYRVIRRAVIARAELLNTPCAWCGGPIDYPFSRAFPRHARAVVVDHVQELHMGGRLHDPGNLTVMHWGCNSVKSNVLRAEARRSAVPFSGPRAVAGSPHQRSVVSSRRW
jgi:5-methylcytosine-specific restriction endonuclease McrA